MSPVPQVKVLAGLGNPGARYDGTRHNIGFALLDRLAGGVSWQSKDQMAVAQVQIGSQSMLLVKPLSFMNRSGEPLGAFLRYRNFTCDNLLVAHDEIDLPIGSLRIRHGGGTGGHNGLNSIVSHCGAEFYRIRLGVGRPVDPTQPVADWVLGRFRSEELPSIEDLLKRGTEAVESLIDVGLLQTQNKFHRV